MFRLDGMDSLSDNRSSPSGVNVRVPPGTGRVSSPGGMLETHLEATR